MIIIGTCSNCTTILSYALYTKSEIVRFDTSLLLMSPRSGASANGVFNFRRALVFGSI